MSPEKKSASAVAGNPRRRRLARVFRYWGPVALMFWITFLFSTDQFSGAKTQGFLENLLGRFLPDLRPETIEWINFLIRKAAHFVEYAILAALLYRAFRGESRAGWRLNWAAWSFAIIVAWSLLDELTQTFRTARDGSIVDSLLDMAGGLSALVLVRLLSRRSSA